MFTVRREGLEAARGGVLMTVIGEMVAEGIWMEKRDERRQI